MKGSIIFGSTLLSIFVNSSLASTGTVTTVDVKDEQTLGERKVYEHLKKQPDQAYFHKKVHVNKPGQYTHSEFVQKVWVGGQLAGREKVVDSAVARVPAELEKVKAVVAQYKNIEGSIDQKESAPIVEELKDEEPTPVAGENQDEEQTPIPASQKVRIVSAALVE